ncbi:hypothetical protein DPX16_6618 [Anabarilius grahami]|uniref:Uncharacterized protein n=1 Tax=Anabarilius grahami TaxID=495550 RepID=A0A3N0Z1H1_ANAGA|nr:hypothetical protein DPX16_6618 [Anabarilius grahami]
MGLIQLGLHVPAVQHQEPEGQTVRIQTARGFDKLAVVQGPASQLNSYVATSQGRQYTRNRRLLLRVQEPAPTECGEDDYNPLFTSFTSNNPPVICSVAISE